MVSLALFLSILAGFGSILFVNEATIGVYIVAWAILFAAWGRVLQAKQQHEDMMGAFTTLSRKPQAPIVSTDADKKPVKTRVTSSYDYR